MSEDSRWVVVVVLQPHQFEVQGCLFLGQRVELWLVGALLIDGDVDHGEQLGGAADVAPAGEGLLLGGSSPRVIRGLW